MGSRKPLLDAHIWRFTIVYVSGSAAVFAIGSAVVVGRLIVLINQLSRS